MRRFTVRLSGSSHKTYTARKDKKHLTGINKEGREEIGGANNTYQCLCQYTPAGWLLPVETNVREKTEGHFELLIAVLFHPSPSWWTYNLSSYVAPITTGIFLANPVLSF